MIVDETPLRAVVAAYEACWNERRFRELRGLWADDDEMPIWLPEEVDHPLTDWAAVAGYWDACETLIERFAVSTRDHRFKPIAPGVAVGVWMLRWNATTWYGNPPRTRAIAGVVRVFRGVPRCGRRRLAVRPLSRSRPRSAAVRAARLRGPG